MILFTVIYPPPNKLHVADPFAEHIALIIQRGPLLAHEQEVRVAHYLQRVHREVEQHSIYRHLICKSCTEKYSGILNQLGQNHESGPHYEPRSIIKAVGRAEVLQVDYVGDNHWNKCCCVESE